MKHSLLCGLCVLTACGGVDEPTNPPVDQNPEGQVAPSPVSEIEGTVAAPSAEIANPQQEPSPEAGEAVDDSPTPEGSGMSAPSEQPDPAESNPPSDEALLDFETVWRMQFGKGVENGEISPDGQWVALGVEIGDSRGVVQIVAAEDGSPIQELVYVDDCSGKKCNEIESMSWSADGELLAVGGNNQPVKIYHVPSGEVRFSRDTKETDGMRASPTGDYFSIASGSSVMIVDLPQLQVIDTLKSHSCGVNTVDFSDDGGLMVTGACDSKLVVWDTSNFEPKQVINAPGSVKTARVTGDGQYLLAAAGDSNAVALYSPSGEQLASVSLADHIQVDDPYVDHAEFSPDGKSFVTQGHGPDVLRFSVPAGEFLSRTPSQGNGEYMHWHGQWLLVTSSDGLVTVFRQN